MSDVLTLTGFAQRQASFRFDVLGPHLEAIGEIDIIAEGATIENNINRNIKRQLNNLVIAPSEGNQIDPLVNRLKVSMIIEGDTTYPLGVFIFQDLSRIPPVIGTDGFITATLLDQGIVLDQGVHRSYAFAPGTQISTAIARLLDAAGLTQYSIEPSTAQVRGSEWVVWPPGTSMLQIINDLCEMGSYYTLYFDNNGIAQVRLVPNLDTVVPVLKYGQAHGEERIYDGTIVESDDTLQAPNRYIVVNNSMTDTPIVGFCDVPDESPNSIHNIGRVIAKVIDQQGLNTTADAMAAAFAFCHSDFSAFSWVTFDAAPDPRHDTFDVVSYNGSLYREQSWSLPLLEGSSHRHELRRVFNEDPGMA